MCLFAHSRFRSETTGGKQEIQLIRLFVLILMANMRACTLYIHAQRIKNAQTRLHAACIHGRLSSCDKRESAPVAYIKTTPGQNICTVERQSGVLLWISRRWLSGWVSPVLFFLFPLSRARHISPVPYSLLNYNSASDTFLRQLMHLLVCACDERVRARRSVWERERKHCAPRTLLYTCTLQLNLKQQQPVIINHWGCCAGCILTRGSKIPYVAVMASAASRLPFRALYLPLRVYVRKRHMPPNLTRDSKLSLNCTHDVAQYCFQFVRDNCFTARGRVIEFSWELVKATNGCNVIFTRAYIQHACKSVCQEGTWKLINICHVNFAY